jgi:hypothetical protein
MTFNLNVPSVSLKIQLDEASEFVSNQNNNNRRSYWVWPMFGSRLVEWLGLGWRPLCQFNCKRIDTTSKYSHLNLKGSKDVDVDTGGHQPL